MAGYRRRHLFGLTFHRIHTNFKKEEGYLETEIQVGMDLGMKHHRVKIFLPDEKMECFDLEHRHASFASLHGHLQELKQRYESAIVMGFEGSGGLASPLDEYFLSKGYEVYNVSSSKLSRFRQLFGADSKNDDRDASLICHFLRMRKELKFDNTPALKLIQKRPTEERIKSLARSISNLMNQKRRMVEQIKAHLSNYFPELLDLQAAFNSTRWIFELLKRQSMPSKIGKLRPDQLKYSKTGIRLSHAQRIIELAKRIEYHCISEEEQSLQVSFLSGLVLNLLDNIETLENKLSDLGNQSKSYQAIDAISGAGKRITGRICGEIGEISRFEGPDALNAYSGLCKLDNSSGKRKSDKKNIQCNKRLKNALLDLAYQATRFNEGYKAYYERKKKEGKKHLQILKAIGRYLLRDIYKRLHLAQKSDVALSLLDQRGDIKEGVEAAYHQPRNGHSEQLPTNRIMESVCCVNNSMGESVLKFVV